MCKGGLRGKVYSRGITRLADEAGRRTLEAVKRKSRRLT